MTKNTGDPLALQLGERIAYDRNEAGMSQVDLATKLNLSQGAICKWESGQNFPTLHNLRRLTSLFGWDDDTFRRFALREESAA